MPSRKSSRSSTRNSFKSASILENGGQLPSSFQGESASSDTAPQDEIELVLRTFHSRSPHLSRPLEHRSSASGGAPAAAASTADAVVDTPVESHHHGASVGVRIDPTTGTQRERFPQKRFGLRTDQCRGQPAQGAPMNYKQKYPEDPTYKETDSDARVWYVYNDESHLFDNDMVIEAGDNLDILLVFAGLFASVLTTFVVQTSQSLSPDKTDISNALLREMISLQRAQENRTSFDSIPAADTSFIPSRGDIWVNSLWFVSLALSLSAALLAVIAKQWLRQYSSFISGTPRERALIRQFRYDGLEKWRVRLIIGLLPTILHISLFLFLAGVVVFLLPLNNTLADIVAGIAGFLCASYILTNILPVIFIQCPYRTPLSEILSSIYGFSRYILLPIQIFVWIFVGFPCNMVVMLLEHMNVIDDYCDWVVSHWLGALNCWIECPITWPKSLKEVERARADERDEGNCPLGMAGALIWLAQTTSDVSVKAIVAEAVGSVSHPLLTPETPSIIDAINQHWLETGRRIRTDDLCLEDDERIFERLMRGILVMNYKFETSSILFHCQTYSTILIKSAINSPSRLHTEDGKWDISPNQAFRFVAGREDLSEELQAPTWIWWLLFLRAVGIGNGWYLYRDQILTMNESRSVPSLNTHRGKWLQRINIPLKLRHTVRQQLIAAYCDSRRISHDKFPDFFESFVASLRRNQSPPPFSMVSLVTFLAENFSEFTDFWMEIEGSQSHPQCTGTLEI